MNIKIIRASKARRRARRDGTTLVDRAFCHAFVDGFVVTCRAGRGWACSCDDDECGHVDALADLLHPDLIAALEEER